MAHRLISKTMLGAALVCLAAYIVTEQPIMAALAQRRQRRARPQRGRPGHCFRALIS